MIEFWIEIIAHTSLFLIFLPLLYFYYVAPLQSYGIIDDIFGIVQPEIVDLTLLSTLNDTRNLNNLIELLNSNIQESENIMQGVRSIETKNAKIFQITNAIFYTLGSVLFTTAVGLTIYYNMSVIEMLLSSIIVLCFIMVSEFAIVGLFFKNFKQLNANFIKGSIIKRFVNPYTNYDCDYVNNYVESLIPSFAFNIYNKLST